MRKSKIAAEKQGELIKYFLLGAAARTAAELAGVNHNTAAYYFQRLRELIFQYREKITIFSGEIEIDESYSVKRPLGLGVLEKVKEDAVQLIKPRYLLAPFRV